jgi:hypothetical protein
MPSNKFLSQESLGAFTYQGADVAVFINELRESHRVDLLEIKITHELELVDLKQSLQRA